MSGSVLVTGGAGFIGSTYRRGVSIGPAGWSVTCLDDLSRGKRERVPDGAGFVQADVRGKDAFTAIADGKFDVVIHMAAQIDVRISVDEPALDASINLVGFANILSGVVAGKTKRVGVFASSAAGQLCTAIPATLRLPHRANRQPANFSVRESASSRASTTFASLVSLHGFEGVALRYSNVYGPRQGSEIGSGGGVDLCFTHAREQAADRVR